MAVIGIGSTSRVAVEDILAIVSAAIEKAMTAMYESIPHPSQLPGGTESPSFFSIDAQIQENAISTLDGVAGVLPLPGDRGGEKGSHLRRKEPNEKAVFKLATLDRSATNSVFEEAAMGAGLHILLLSLDELHGASTRCVTHSEKSVKLYGIPSIAEAAALAACGPKAKLLIPRFCGRNTTASVAIS